MEPAVRRHSPQHPLAFGSLRSWLRLRRENPAIDWRYRDRELFVVLVGLLTLPLRILERSWYDRHRAAPALRDPPIFIIGHWRTGTTFLHGLLSADPQLGYVTLYQTIAPGAFWSGRRTVKPVIALLAPRKRMMDDIVLTIDGAQEEEWALANLSPYSFYHHWSFPRNARYYFTRYALFEGVPESVQREWKALYRAVLQKAGARMAGRRLVLKNPTNTGRLPILLELFPDAKFIFLYRDPYATFQSSLHFHQKILEVAQLQELSDEELEDNILGFYRLLLQKYLADKSLIPPGNLVEVRYEDLEAQPLATVQRTYETLGLPYTSAAQTAFRAHLESQKNYTKNTFVLSDKVVQKVNRHWRFAFETWGYPLVNDMGYTELRSQPAISTSRPVASQ